MKYRGVCKETGEWVVGMVDSMRKNIVKTYTENGEEKFIKIPVESRTVTAYVGIRDNFDNDLFEGDIIEIDSIVFSGRYVISWDSKNLRYIFLANDGYLTYQDFKHENFYRVDCIYE